MFSRLYLFLKRWSLPLFVLVFLLVSMGFLIQNPPTMGGHRIPHFDKIAHFFLFMILAASMHLAFAPRAWVGLSVLLVYGIAIEWIQYHIPGRGAEVMDVVADMLGALTFYGLLFLFRRFFRPRRL